MSWLTPKRLAQAPSTVEVRVVDEAGRPLAGVTVRAAGEGSRSRTTGDDGRAVLERGLEPLELFAHADGHVGGEATVPEGATRVELRLRRGPVVFGHVRTPSGEPAPGLEVSTAGASALTGPDGAFRVAGTLEGEQGIFCRDPGGARHLHGAARTIVAKAGVDTRVDLEVFELDATVSITVVSPEGDERDFGLRFERDGMEIPSVTAATGHLLEASAPSGPATIVLLAVEPWRSPVELWREAVTLEPRQTLERTVRLR